ncbi:ABC transporter ATP-binding protein [Candidatus Bathyarchaeota archaeon]|nr:ABC transporter ATP-binding protein [Candidatus Bathyarchaeota archaeon]
MSDALTLSNVDKTYRNNGREVTALDNVNLKVSEKSFLCVVGPSGSGKTTLLRVSAGYLAPDNGNVTIFGQNIYSLPLSERLNLRNRVIGFLFQGDQLLEDLTAYENIELPLVIQGMPTKLRRDRVRQALESVGIPTLADSRPSEVSGGEKRRISLARSLINGARVLFADEPTSNLDTRTAGMIVQLLRNLNASGMTILAATHDPLIASEASAVVKMRDGRIES